MVQGGGLRAVPPSPGRDVGRDQSATNPLGEARQGLVSCLPQLYRCRILTVPVPTTWGCCIHVSSYDVAHRLVVQNLLSEILQYKRPSCRVVVACLVHVDAPESFPRVGH